jgi:hypothetical protein
MDKNQLILQGRIASPFKEGKTQNGDNYMWFLFEIESRANATSTENNYHQKLNVMCFKPKVIQYLHRMKAHQGCVCVIFGFISAFLNEIKGKSLVTNAVNANEILLIQTRPFND